MKKQLPQKTTLQSDKKSETPLTDAFLTRFFRVCRDMGKELNGLERAHFIAIVKKYYIVEEVLDMLQTIEKHEEGERALLDLQETLKEQPIQGPTIVSTSSGTTFLDDMWNNDSYTNDCMLGAKK